MQLLQELLDSTSPSSPEMKAMASYVNAIAKALFSKKAGPVKDPKRGKEEKFFGVSHERSKLKDHKGRHLMLTFDNSTDSGEFEINSLSKLMVDRGSDLDKEIRHLYKEFEVESKKRTGYVVVGDRSVLREVHLGREIGENTVRFVHKLIRLLSGKPEKVEEAMVESHLKEGAMVPMSEEAFYDTLEYFATRKEVRPKVQEKLEKKYGKLSNVDPWNWASVSFHGINYGRKK